MRQPRTFILTLMLDDPDSSIIRGRIRSVESDQEINFVGVEELVRFVRGQVARRVKRRQNDPNKRHGR